MSEARRSGIRARVWALAGVGALVVVVALIAGMAGRVADWRLVLAVSGAALLGVTVAAWGLLVPIDETVRALAQGLLSFREKDFSARVVEGRRGLLREVVQRFNALGEELRAERNTLYQKEMMFETVLEGAPMAIVLCDEAGIVVFGNSAARELFREGRPLQGQSFVELARTVSPQLVDALEGPEDKLFTLSLDRELETYHASKRYFELNMQRHTLYLVKPLSREIARQEIEVWKKTIRVISHELNNSLAPVSSLLHSARTIASKPEHAHRLTQVFDTIEDRTNHLKGFLDAYARFARLPQPKPAPVAWPEFLETLRALYPFRLEHAPPAEPGVFDPGQLQQVLINLLKNAMESGGPPDEIVLAIDRLPDGWEFRVLDRGVGMTNEVLAKALTIFYSTKRTGSGLGLTLSREIIEAHGGRLSIHQREGGGTMVSFWLPAR